VAPGELEAAADGRTARRDRNRRAVLDAVIELFAEDVEPSPEAVAQRSGLSPRSVYRYFVDRDALVRAAIERQLELVYPLYLIHALGEGDLAERIDRFVHSRLRLYEAVADSARAARHRAWRDPVIREQVAATRVALREQVALQFAPELDALDATPRRTTLAAIDALSQFDSLEYLRHAQGLSRGAVRAILVGALERLLAPAPPEAD
jgi:AcrR family transcriptional regulator